MTRLKGFHGPTNSHVGRQVGSLDFQAAVARTLVAGRLSGRAGSIVGGDGCFGGATTSRATIAGLAR